MKTLASLLLALLLLSCGAMNINNFYDMHRNDPGVTAVEVPNFVLEVLKNSTPEMRHLLDNVEDVRFMSLPAKDPAYNTRVGMEIDRITATGYTDVYRRTGEDLTKSLFSVKENGNRITELVWFDQGYNNSLLLYFKGNFDPKVIQKLSDTEEIDDIKHLLREQ
ncbi:DUF4252 domain-containing protein [Robertkochia flava]|uniref:DUF4252 domain-containing protein n=1 Tax=Robertkochia flava TaxID=3447986 RepID=UPI001CCDD6EB|nr:DUF4252 domain-containing protein [Robertkochia marina]